MIPDPIRLQQALDAAMPGFNLQHEFPNSLNELSGDDRLVVLDSPTTLPNNNRIYRSMLARFWVFSHQNYRVQGTIGELADLFLDSASFGIHMVGQRATWWNETSRIQAQYDDSRRAWLGSIEFQIYVTSL